MNSLEKLKEILKNTDDLYLRSPIEEIQPSMNLITDLGIDSLTRITIFYEITDHFEVEVDEEIAASWNTISDVTKFIEQL